MLLNNVPTPTRMVLHFSLLSHYRDKLNGLLFKCRTNLYFCHKLNLDMI